MGSSEGRVLDSSVLEASRLPEEGGAVVAAEATAPPAPPEDPSISESRAAPMIPARSPVSEPPPATDSLPEEKSSPSDEPPTLESVDVQALGMPEDSGEERALRTALFGSDRNLTLVGKGDSEDPGAKHPLPSEVPLGSGPLEVTESHVPGESGPAPVVAEAIVLAPGREETGTPVPEEVSIADLDPLILYSVSWLLLGCAFSLLGSYRRGP